MLDVCHLDEAGIGMTLPTAYTWALRAKTLQVPYEANAKRRLNMLGAYFTDGPLAGRLEYQLYLGLPKSRSKKTPGALLPLPEGVRPEEVGPIDGHRLLAFIWRIADRPADQTQPWQRVRPLYIWLDNYSVHVGQIIQQAIPSLEAAGIHLRYLPTYSPELSKMEPVWLDVKYHRMVRRSFQQPVRLRQEAKEALDQKAQQLWDNRPISTNSIGPPT